MCHTNNMKKEITWAIQPSTWTNFDAYGCLWATSVEHARRLAALLGEPATLWACPAVGTAYALCRI